MNVKYSENLKCNHLFLRNATFVSTVALPRPHSPFLFIFHFQRASRRAHDPSARPSAPAPYLSHTRLIARVLTLQDVVFSAVELREAMQIS